MVKNSLQTYRYNFILTRVKKSSDCVITAILDHPNSFMACRIPAIVSTSDGHVLRNLGNMSVLERRGEPDVGEI